MNKKSKFLAKLHKSAHFLNVGEHWTVNNWTLDIFSTEFGFSGKNVNIFILNQFICWEYCD